MARSKHYYVRKTHRYLGIILGIQFLVWTTSGLYFSWSNLAEINGNYLQKQPLRLSGNLALVSPTSIFDKLDNKVDSIHSIQLVSILGKPFYNLQFFVGSTLEKKLFDAITGSQRPEISKDESIEIAAGSFNGQPKLQSIEYLTSINGHHEYRGKPLPAWAVTFEHPSNTTIYVAVQSGRVEGFRNNKWRIFDFLWMSHIMDYNNRSNINNWLLRIFSAFGLLTVLSGFLLFVVSSRPMRRKTRAGMAGTSRAVARHAARRGRYAACIVAAELARGR